MGRSGQYSQLRRGNADEIAVHIAPAKLEEAHRVIQEHALAVAQAIRQEGAAGGEALLERLASDSRLRLTRGQLDALLAEPMAFTGAAARQVAAVVERVAQVAQRYPQAAAYEPEAIL